MYIHIHIYNYIYYRCCILHHSRIMPTWHFDRTTCLPSFVAFSPVKAKASGGASFRPFGTGGFLHEETTNQEIPQGKTGGWWLMVGCLFFFGGEGEMYIEESSLLGSKKYMLWIRLFTTLLDHAISKVVSFSRLCFPESILAGQVCWGHKISQQKTPETKDFCWKKREINRKEWDTLPVAAFSYKMVHFVQVVASSHNILYTCLI